jgi:glycosyltransferase involved in cell wall biosynthesis
MTYLLISHVPIYCQGNHHYLSTEWKRSLSLLRDSFEGKLGPISLLAPSIPFDEAQSDQVLEEVCEEMEGISCLPGPDLRGSAKQYWFKQNSLWTNLVKTAVSQAAVVHAGIDQLWKPIQYRGFLEGYRQNKPTIFITDTDLVTQIVQLSQDLPYAQKIKDRLYAKALDQVIGWSVGKADLSLLKGEGLLLRYGGQAKNAKNFQDTSYLSSDVISVQALDERLRKNDLPPILRLVYCGRLEERKGVLDSIRLIHEAKMKGIGISLDLIGDGPQRLILERETQTLHLEEEVRFLGAMPYGSALLNRLSVYDALLFTPQAEDTPRMIFDGFAAGLPLLGHDIPYARELLAKNHAGILWKKGRGLEVLAKLNRDRSQLSDLAYEARLMGLYHAADIWYKRRAEWTFEAIDRHARI